MTQSNHHMLEILLPINRDQYDSPPFVILNGEKNIKRHSIILVLISQGFQLNSKYRITNILSTRTYYEKT